MAKTENRLSRESVAEGALALADAEGLDALTIRRLAQELNVTPMALYWHFKNKDELLDGVLGRLWARVDTTRDRSRPPLEQFRALTESLLTVLREHRALAPLLQIPRSSEPSPGFLDAVETALDILVEFGFDVPTAAAICTNALRTTTALVLGEPGAATPQQSPDDAAESSRRKRLTLESLPPQRYPNVVQAAPFLTFCADPEDHYTFGVDFFIGGIAALPLPR
ncbi:MULTISPECIES: TetR/AcrR family transcriptional regulator [unclassified Nocardia]|uniref:TetR/AcrR family transcriptional regulator n=1 Tax=unclassified Nocardia TaxID=2637762 RepID=UPI0035D9878E